MSCLQSRYAVEYIQTITDGDFILIVAGDMEQYF
jgi:hypothetical protein